MKSQFEGQFPSRLQEDMSDYLETEFNDYFTITWSSSDESVFTNSGEYIKPLIDTPVVISYRIEVDENHFVEDAFEMLVLGASDDEKLDIVAAWLQNDIIPDLNISSDILLPTSHPDHGTEIVWSSSNETIAAENGVYETTIKTNAHNISEFLTLSEERNRRLTKCRLRYYNNENAHLMIPRIHQKQLMFHRDSSRIRWIFGGNRTGN